MENTFTSTDDLIGYIDFMLRVLIKNIQSEYMSRYIKGQKMINVYSLVPFIDADVFKNEEEHENFSLEGKRVVAFPYENKKMFGAFKHIRDEGYRSQMHDPDTPDGIYFPEIELALIHNGQHHIAAAWEDHYKGVKAKITVISLDKAINIVKVSDKDNLWIFDNEEKPIVDARFAMIFELYRKRKELEGNRSKDNRNTATES